MIAKVKTIGEYNAGRIRSLTLKALMNPNLRRGNVIAPVLRKASGRVSCRDCGEIIEKDELAIKDQWNFHNGRFQENTRGYSYMARRAAIFGAQVIWLHQRCRKGVNGNGTSN